MEILFKNRHTRTKAVMKEIYRYYFFQRKLFVLSYALLFVEFLYGLYLAFEYRSYFLVICIPLLYAFQLFRYFITVNTLLRRDKEISDKEIEAELVVTDEFVQNTSSTGAVVKIEYNNVKKAIQTKNLILLVSKASMIYIFRKDSFEVGTKDGFISFLKTKGIKVLGK